MMESWNVRMNITTELIPTFHRSNIPFFRRSIIPPQYSGCVRIARTRSSNNWDSGVTLPSASLCTFHAASSFSAVASSYVRCSTCPLAFLLALSSAFLSTSGKCLALRTASYCCLVTVRSMRYSWVPSLSLATQSIDAPHCIPVHRFSRPVARRDERRPREDHGHVRRVDRAAQRHQDALLGGQGRYGCRARARSVAESARQGRPRAAGPRLHHLLH